MGQELSQKELMSKMKNQVATYSIEAVRVMITLKMGWIPGCSDSKFGSNTTEDEL